ncbi:MAG: Alkyl hydroperoxide reductase/Thiol specific antioxidant [Gammaproteobacteria bacterium]|jgi:peroxiredoxin Q/BCP|nr:Alkyl hydroperoxide reductase/Thiol specific antioxidant [Gammaproteobacteria bacterium]
MTIQLNFPVPDFALPATDGHTVTLSALKGHPVILYFYPKDNTPGCTKQGECFRDKHPDFTKLNAIILGVSRDSLKSHANFKTKFNFPFELLSDIDSKVCELYEVIKDKNMYGKQVKGIERSTFLIDKNGILRQKWHKVKVDGHIDEVLSALAKI